MDKQLGADPSATLLQRSRRQNPGNPTAFRHVYSVIDINEVAKIDGVEQSFSVDFYLSNMYAEPELVVLPPEDGLPLQSHQTTALDSSGYGLIKLEFTNKRNLETLFEERLGYIGLPPMVAAFQ